MMKTKKKSINLRKTLKITNHLKEMENHFNTIISSPNASQLFQSHSAVSEKILCKINLDKIDQLLLQQIKQQKNILKPNIHKSLLSDKLLKELEKQIQLLQKLKIENNVFKKMHFFKCCCAKKNCKKSNSNKKIKKKRDKKNKRIKRATQLQLFDNDENEISCYVPEFDEISIFNEKLMAADQKTSNLEIVSPSCSVNHIRAMSTKSESLFSYSSTNNKYSKNEDLDRLPQSKLNNILDPKLNLSQKITQENVMKEKSLKINDLDSKLDELVSLSQKKKRKLNGIQENVMKEKTLKINDLDSKLDELVSLSQKKNRKLNGIQENVMKEKTLKINDLDSKLDELVSSQKKKRNTKQENVMKEKTLKIKDLDSKLDELVLSQKKKHNLNTKQKNVKEVKTNEKEDDSQKNIIKEDSKTLIPTQDNVNVKDVRNNTIESLIPIDKIIPEANKKIKDTKNVWFERKLNKCRKSKVNEKFFAVDCTNKKNKIVTSTEELIDERELHLVFNKNQDAAANVCFKDVNVKSIKRKTNMEKKKVRDVNKWIKLEVKEKSKNESDAPKKEAQVKKKKETQVKKKKETQVKKKKENEFLKPNEKKNRKNNNSLMDNTGVGLADISQQNVLENQKMLEIRKRIELWQEFGSPWINDAISVISVSGSEDVEANEMKNQMSQSTFWESPNFSPIPKM